MLMVLVNVDQYMAFKQIRFSVNLGDKKNSFSSVFFNIQKSSVSPFGSVDRLVMRFKCTSGFRISKKNCNIVYLQP